MTPEFAQRLKKHGLFHPLQSSEMHVTDTVKVMGIFYQKLTFTDQYPIQNAVSDTCRASHMLFFPYPKSFSISAYTTRGDLP